jgi:methyl-accepting chemotaxis protein
MMQWTIRRRLGAIGALSLVAVASVGGIGAVQLARTDGRDRQALAVANLRATVIDAQHTVAVVYADTHILAKATDPGTRKDPLAEMDEHAEELRDSVAALQGVRVEHDVDAQLADTFLPAINAVLADADAIHAADGVVTTDQVEAVQQAWDTFDHASDDLGGVLDSLAEHTEGAAHAQAGVARWEILGVSVLAIALAVFGLLVTARAIIAPLRRTRELLVRVAGGDFTGRVVVRSEDEVGEMAAALNTTVERIGESLRAMGQEANALQQASLNLDEVSRTLSAGAQSTGEAATAAVHSAAEVNDNVQAAAAGTGQVSSSILHAAQDANEVVVVVNEAVAFAEQANQTISKLGESSIKIGEVAKLITTIAEQTNLLALNATIEAARAGEMGKGFAVVAGEVKDLAKDTARATEDIDARIGAIQADSVSAAQALQQISATITRVSDVQHRIAAAMEQQTGATADMQASMARAAAGTETITTRIASVEQSSQSARHTAEETQNAAQQLAGSAASLRRIVDGFQLTA